MARPVKKRKILIPHKEIVFRPEGKDKKSGKSVTLLTEEYEVIKLIDYENMNHLQASKIIGISRPTLTRIYSRARKKIAECLVELNELRVEGGNSVLGENWLRCSDCGSVFNMPGKDDSKNCPVCNSKKTGELK